MRQLPPTSRFQAARAEDVELAKEQFAESAEDESAQRWTPPLTEWDTRAEIDARMLDRLGDMVQAVLSTIPVEKGKARPKYKYEPFPRPRTALDEVKELAAREAVDQVLAWFFPHANNN